MGRRVDEDWSEEDLDLLLKVAWDEFGESVRCHEAGIRLAALVMLGGALEAQLMAMIVVHQERWQAEGRWPEGVSHLDLRSLTRLAAEANWLPSEVAAEIEVLIKVRNLAVHPGAHVRWLRQDPDVALDDEAGYLAVFDIFVKAFKQLASVIDGVRPADSDGSAA